MRKPMKNRPAKGTTAKSTPAVSASVRLPTDREIWQLVQALSLREKTALLSGADFWTTKANEKRGIPALRMADGPLGVRYEDLRPAAVQKNGGKSRRATCFPAPSALAASFDVALLRRVGEAMAEECLAEGVGMLLAPGVNIKRSPLCGRNFEYFSEDPVLAGELAAGFIAGLQGRGVAACIKHFAANNQETQRMSISAAVDDRALFDIYLRAFEIALRKAKPATVMASYNEVDGVYATESPRLLRDILRTQLGFDGAVVSDWTAVNDRAAGVAAGMDLEMPASGGVNDRAVEREVRAGRLPARAVDVACYNLLRVVFRYSRAGKRAPAANYRRSHTLAVQALAESTVLLKNDGMLPLACGERIAVIGEMAANPRIQGGGSSLVNARSDPSLLKALKRAGHPFVYAPGHRGEETTPEMLGAAAAAALAAGRVVLVLGLPASYECEGFDRDHLRLPDCQLQLLRTVAKANANLCVVLVCGAPVETPWLDDVRALLAPYLGGEGLGEGVAKLLFGEANPCGKLPESWPLQLGGTPSAGHFPMGPLEVRYTESIFVGYRYYDTAQKPVRFPFGHGLSYTQFAYEGLRLEAGAPGSEQELAEGQRLAAGQALALRFTVRNTGPRDGAEVAQVYLARRGSAAFQPAHELVAFAKVTLKAGEAREVRVRIPYRELGYWNTALGRRSVEGGRYEVQVGASSRDLPLAAAFAVAGERVAPRKPERAGGPYDRVVDNLFSDAHFAALYAKPFKGNRLPERGEYRMDTPLSLMQGSGVGRALYGIAKRVAGRVLHFSTDAAANARAAAQMAHDMPFKNILPLAGGVVTPAAAEALLGWANGKSGMLRVKARLLRLPERKRRGQHDAKL